MSVRSAGKAIREARLKTGLTQEKLSENVCSVLSLSRIENGTSGVSPSTFQALMAKAGAPCEVFPVFANRQDFDCFYTLKKARFYLDSWQLRLAYLELETVEKMNWADNKFYYQEWLLLHCQIQFRSGCGNHTLILHTLLDALHITREKIDIEDFRGTLLSLIEIELLISLAQEYLYLDDASKCLTICTQLSSYLENAQITFLEKNRLLADNAIVYSKYLISIKDYKTALAISDSNRHQMVLDSENSLLYELTFLTAVGYHYTNNSEKALELFKTAFYAAHAIESCYATTCKRYAENVLHIPLPRAITELHEIPYVSFTPKTATNSITLHDGTYDFNSDVLYFGDLIRELRMDQKLSQTIICQGLCSKSKLSKIENNLLQPDVALAEALLQRLGYSERIFIFWGNDRENELHNLKFQLIHSQRTRNINKALYLRQFKSLLTKKDILNWQYYLYKKAKDEKNSNNRISILLQALHLTLPNFDINHILNYRLTYVELSILNSIGQEYLYTDNPHKSIVYYNCLIEYMKQSSYDMFMQNNVFSVTISEFAKILYIQKLFHDIINLKQYIICPFMKYAVHFLGLFLFYYCQALGECGYTNDVALYANYACAIEDLIEFTPNSEALKNGIFDDFHIALD